MSIENKSPELDHELLTLPTDSQDVILRELTIKDAPAYFDAWQNSIKEIAEYDPDTLHKYDTLEAVEKSFAETGRLRMGIWDKDEFVGSTSLRPNIFGDAIELGYWVDSRKTGHGYASLAAKTLTAYAVNRYPLVQAEVMDDNARSVKILEKSGFKSTGRHIGEFALYEIMGKDTPRKVSISDTEKFSREGFDGNIYVLKEFGAGFTALQVDVHGRHPRKRMLEGTTRSYYVVDGEGTFTLGDTSHPVAKGDLFVIPAGGEYEYEGEMTLFEFNVSPDNTFRDEKLE